MKILVICQHYQPEPFRLSDICEALAECGHDVTVVTGTPNYPMGEIYEGYENGQHGDETIGGVRIHRCRIHPRKTGVVHRVWNYYSYEHASTKYIKKLDDSYDVVWINQLSPVMMAEAGIQYAQRHRKPSVLYCLDLWPASLSAGGITGGPVYRYFHHVSKKIYRSADRILMTSQSFADYFRREFGITDTTYLPQYSEDIFDPDHCRKEPDSYTDLMFAGNIGVAQSVDTILRAAEILRDREDIRWHIVGDGSELPNIRKTADERHLENVIFYGRQPLEKMPELYAKADAMLVTLYKDPFVSLTLPGKVQTYMAAGKPIVGAIDGFTVDILHEAECGPCVRSEDAQALAEAVRKLADRHEWLPVYGANSRSYFEQNFTKQQFINQLEKILESAVNK